MTPSVASLVTTLVTVALVALRIAPTVVLLPSLGSRTLPPAVRLAVIITLAVGVLPVAGVSPVTMEPSAPDAPGALDLACLAVGCVRELTVGVALALVLSAPFMALDHAGRLLDAARGVGAAQAPSLSTGESSTPLAGMLQATGVVVFVSAGGHRGVLQALAVTYSVVPPGGQVSTPHLVDLAARWTAGSLAAALTLGSAAGMALLAAEGVLAVACRLSPELSRAGIALPVRVLVPLAALAAAAGLWTDATLQLCARALAAARSLGG